MIDGAAGRFYFLVMGDPNEGSENPSHPFDPLRLVAGQMLYVDRGEDLTAWTHTGFAVRKLENAPKDGAFDDVPLTWSSAQWAKVRRLFHRKA